MGFTVEIMVGILSFLSVIVGLLGLQQILHCKIKRIRGAIISVQTVAILLAIVHSALHWSDPHPITDTFLLYLILNSSFLLMVQIVAFMACMPKPKSTEIKHKKARVRIRTQA